MDLNFNAGYICGVLCSVGSIEWRENFSNYWIVLETVEDELANRFFSFLASLTNGKLTHYKLKKKYKEKEYITNNIILRGKKDIKSFLDKWGLKPSSRDWCVPPIAFRDQNFRRGFLQGFFDSGGTIRLRLRNHKDGHKQKCRSIRLSSVNLNGLEQIRQLLELEGIKCIIYAVNNYFFLEIDGKNRVAEFVKKINFGVSKKREKLELSLNPINFEYAMKL